MIYYLNHHTPYNYSKFTSRPTVLFKLGVRLEKANIVDNRTKSKNQHSNKMLKNNQPVKKDSFFQSKEMLCWRADIGFFNLRGFFFNMLKALHVCWSLVRNNKKIVLVGNAGTLELGSIAIDSMLQFYPRDTLPRIKQYHYDHNLNEIKIKKIKKKNTTSFLDPLTKLLYYKDSTENRKQKQISNENDATIDPAHHRLHGLLYQAASRRPISYYGEVPAYFFSNAQKPFQEKFNHLNHLETENAPLFKSKSMGTVLRALEFGYSASLSNSGNEFDKASLYGYKSQRKTVLANVIVNRTVKKRASKKHAAKKGNSKLFLKKSSVSPILAIRKSKPKALFSLDNDNFNPLKRVQWNHFHRSRLKLLKLAKKDIAIHAGHNKPEPLLGQKPEFKFRKHKNFKRYKSQSKLKFQKWWKAYNYYLYLVGNHNHKRNQLFAKNLHLTQADLVFFTNPDKHAGLAAQVKALNIPTIGIVSGLKTSEHRQYTSENNLHDSVTYPIVGNPENAAFVLMILRVFITLIKQIHVKPLKTHFFTSPKNLYKKKQLKGQTGVKNKPNVSQPASDFHPSKKERKAANFLDKPRLRKSKKSR